MLLCLLVVASYGETKKEAEDVKPSEPPTPIRKGD
ncbi:hypothetical protein TcasGA2_TC032866 [Tribolium castaneum]|uniref:Uncharacterized protein n=1 Tax=Tribolium castaneum TaxID=7070 RepID=A0A139WJU7_TRICA|nr:hypothetical protein TcasGA2_TC032866 [Tribolium castaneum]